MIKKSLSKSNPYIKKPSQRKSLFLTAITSSTAVEGVHIAVSPPTKRKSADTNNNNFH